MCEASRYALSYTATVCNVIELFDVRPRTPGYMDGRIRASYPNLPPMVGYASTATFRSAAPPRAGNVYSGLAEQVASFAELPGPAVVVKTRAPPKEPPAHSDITPNSFSPAASGTVNAKSR